MASALLTGNTFIMKPSPFAPCANLKLAELAQQYFPPGVVQCLSGDDQLGPWLTAHPGIDKVSFTGSVATGKRVMESCSRTLKRVTLELGGNDAAIVFPDIPDVAATAAAIAQACFLNTGQICVSIKRLYVHADIYDAFRDAFVAVANALPYGDGFAGAGDPAAAPFMGPLSTEFQYRQVLALLDDVRNTKLNVVGGDAALAAATDTAAAGKGYFVRPVVVDNPPDTARIVVEEAFGPTVPLLKWSDEADVLRRANDTQLGLGASVWSGDLKHAGEVARQLEAGNVWVNSHLVRHPLAPLVGYKWSGLGAEGGIDGLKQYCNIQALHLPN
ncbi:betaine aldehyde dehydrogenase [Sporothrix brasiliensis 5110]|uniref:aldehyde dehydrogenase (NAD(+)) n=1 Tax=Sporothrix brasiliensis 5110 TaxID=1398154 RepID=A0A0C2EYV5_9PEZI|nr:betaine aldehyde dehydrogenase [Sporothrix brasiliensis 5110]KIH91644.1 betaine aldehyde dehydrogenase [Sporothrix brasiliensis 5110]